MSWDWSFAWSLLPTLLRGVAVTIEATVAGFAIAIAVGLVFAIGRNTRSVVVRKATSVVVHFVRGTPLLVQLYVIFFVLPDVGVTLPAFAAGVIGLGLHYAAYMSEVFRAGINSVPAGQWEAARACQLNGRQTWVRIILPQAIPKMIPASGNYVIGMMKEAALLSAISVNELMSNAKAIGDQTFRYIEPLTMVGAIYLSLTLFSASALKWLERRTNRR